jgi:Tol biopolymer transport system component/tRNA A-37 threonylcarbamoyl transferase component Bud32
MTVTPGTLLGHYTISAPLGAGGMGEVYRATDKKLGRDVAIKVLPRELAGDPERLARFEREAKLLASLNHSNIAHVYGFESATLPDGSTAHFLAMELVEGEDLAERLKRGPIPLEDALPLAKQIAEALEEAHEQGIVHRDLKPANVKATPDAKVKVLDFGLAKAYAGDSATGSGSHLSQSPTLAHTGTEAGLILGTAAYMSPEQARGKTVDKRTDIWAFGVVLYEMLTGRRLFEGDTVSDVLAGVLKTEIALDSLPDATPPAIRQTLRRCLERNPKNRLHDIADARLVIDDQLAGRLAEAATPAAAHGRPSSVGRPTVLLAGAILLVVLGAAAGWLARRPAPPAQEPLSRLSMRLPAENPYRVRSVPGCSIAISRDGSLVAYIAAFENRDQLVVRALDELQPRAVVTSETVRQPFFSPDGKWIGYFGDNVLQKVSVEGGRPVTLVPELPNAAWVRGAWSDDGQIVFDTWNAGLRVVSADGGEVRVLTQPKDEWDLGPELIPGTSTVLFFTESERGVRIEAIGLDGSGRRTVLDDASQPRALDSGHLLFERNGGLFVAPFDAKSATVTGPTMPVALETMGDDETAANPVPQLAISSHGTLVYAPRQPSARAPSELVWVDRQGNSEPLATVPYPYTTLDLSPDGGQLALAGRDGAQVRLAILDLARQTLNPLRDERLEYPTAPVFSADGSEIFFARYGPQRGEILAQKLDGGEPRLLGRLEGTWLAPYSVSHDGRWLVGTLFDPKTQSDIWSIDLTASDPERAARVFAVPGPQEGPVLSPDGRWLAYGTKDTGSYEVYVQRFPGGESKVRVSSGGGQGQRWSPDGRELFYLGRGGVAVVAVTVKTDPKLELGAPRKLFGGAFVTDGQTGPAFDVSNDGKRFALLLRRHDPRHTVELIVVQNWFTEVSQLFRAGSR